MSVMHKYWASNYRGTASEHALEPHIAALGYLYRTQFPLFVFGLGKYFPDFAIFGCGVVVEVDDDSHDDPEKQKADAARTKALEAIGWRVLRCSNHEARHEPQTVIRRIQALLAAEGVRPVALPPPRGDTKRPKRKPKRP